MIFSVDGIGWNLGCTINRTAEMTPSEISGLMLNRSYFNDVLGTYMKYDVRIEVPFGRESEYATFYEQITQPVPAHEFVLPYGTGTIEIVGRVENIADVYVRMPNNEVHWKGISFTIIANHPTKKLTLEEAIITMGIPPLPPESSVNVGDAYVYTVNGWELIEDGEDNYY